METIYKKNNKNSIVIIKISLTNLKTAMHHHPKNQVNSSDWQSFFCTTLASFPY